MTTSIVSEAPTVGPDQQAPIAGKMRFSSLEEITDALDAGSFEWKSDTYVVQAQCPAHDGGGLALKIKMKDGTNGGEELDMRCWSHRCEFKTIIRALHQALAGELVSTRELEQPSGGGNKGTSGSSRQKPWEREHTLTTYAYQDIFGHELFRKEKFKFTDEQGGKTYMVKPRGGAVPIFYHAPGLEAAKQTGDTIWWVEGEKDAESLAALGITAVSIHQGGNATIDIAPYIAQLTGIGRVIIATDRDLVGYEFSLRIHAALTEAGIESSIRRTTLDVPKADVTDHIEAELELDDMETLTADDLRELIAGAEDAVEAQTETADFSFGGVNETPEEAAASFGEVADEGGDGEVHGVVAEALARTRQREVRANSSSTSAAARAAVANVLTASDVKHGRFSPEAIKKAMKVELNDIGLGYRIAMYADGQWAFRSGLGWYVYDGKVWEPTFDIEVISALARRVIESIKLEMEVFKSTSPTIIKAQEAFEAADKSDMGEWAKAKTDLERAKRSALQPYERFYDRIANGESHIKAGISSARDHLSVPLEQWSDDPTKINCQNGLVNLRTGEIEPHDFRRYLTKIAAVAYVPGATHTDFDMLLEGIADGTEDDEMPAFLMRWYGQCLTGLTTGRKFLYPYGAGKAGKTTLNSVFENALGGESSTSYAATAMPTVFEKRRRSDNRRDDLHCFMGVRMVTIGEAEDGNMDANQIKEIAGGGKIQSRENYGRFTTWCPCLKMIFIGNSLMGIPTGDDAFLARFVPIHFRKALDPRKRDGNLIQRLEGREQMEAALAAAVAGAVEWFSAGGDEDALGVPASVDHSKAEIVADQDDLGEWLADHMAQPGDVYEPLSMKELHIMYVTHQRQQGIHATLLPARFRHQLKSRGVTVDGNTTVTWGGINRARKTGRFVSGFGRIVERVSEVSTELLNEPQF